MSDRIPGGVIITRADIEAYKREILEQSVLVRLRDAAVVAATTPRKLMNDIRDGKLTAYNDRGAGVKGVRVLASELQRYVREMRIDPDEWRR